MSTSRLMCIVAIGLLAGCSSGPEPTPTQRQDAILKDPMNYRPTVGGNSSGGDITDFDQRGFGHDLNDVLNP